MVESSKVSVRSYKNDSFVEPKAKHRSFACIIRFMLCHFHCALVGLTGSKSDSVQSRGALLGIGLVHPEGISVPGLTKSLGFSAFEKHIGGKAHRPCEFTVTSTGNNLQASP